MGRILRIALMITLVEKMNLAKLSDIKKEKKVYRKLGTYFS
jgi:hypothetical protein